MTDETTAPQGEIMIPETGTDVAVAAEMTLLQMAISKGMGVEELKALMDMQDRIDAKAAEKAFVAAMTVFKETPPTIRKDKHVAFDTNKGRTEYDHATEYQVVHLISAALSKIKITARWKVTQTEKGSITVTCIITHINGHSDEASLSASSDTSGGKNHVQGVVSTVTYFKRQTILLVTGLAVDGQDDDGRGSTLISEDQFAEINGLMEESGVTSKQVCERYGIDSVKDLPASKFTEALNTFRNHMRNSKNGQQE